MTERPTTAPQQLGIATVCVRKCSNRCGWRIVRIWSTDWVRDPISQIDRVVAAFEAAVSSRQLSLLAIPEDRHVERPVDEVPVSTNHDGPKTSNTPTLDYQKIEDVPSSVIKGLILSTLEKYGVTEESELTVSVARQLGFHRTGVKIRARIRGCFVDLLTEKKIVRTDENVLKLSSESDLKLA